MDTLLALKKHKLLKVQFSPHIYLYVDSEYFTLLAPTFIMVNPMFLNSNMTRFGHASPHRARMARYIPYRVLVTSCDSCERVISSPNMLCGSLLLLRL